jgi:hypothetical protein
MPHITFVFVECKGWLVHEIDIFGVGFFAIAGTREMN